MKSKLSIRIKLSDFINTELENDIMNLIIKSHEDLLTNILVYFWYNDKEISNKKLEQFILRWEDKLEFKTIIKIGCDLNFNDFVWWDILSYEFPINNKTRHTYRYYSYVKILDGIKKFYECARFVLSEKPHSKIRKQKRND
jgi:hypothetical protein